MSTLAVIATSTLTGVIGAAAMYVPARLARHDARTYNQLAERKLDECEQRDAAYEQSRGVQPFWSFDAPELPAAAEHEGEVLHVEPHETGEHQLPALVHIDELIAASSLGTPDAVQLRESVDDEVARRIVERSKEFGGWLADANAAAEEHVAERLDVSAELAKLKQRAAEAERACCEGHDDEPCDPRAGYVLPCCGDCPDWPRFIALDDQPEHDDEDAPADDTDRPGLHLVLLAIPVALWDRLHEWWQSLWASRRERHMVGSGEQATSDDPFAELLAHVEDRDVEERRVEIEAWVQRTGRHSSDVHAVDTGYRGRRWEPGIEHTGVHPIVVPAQRDGGDDL